MFFLALFFWLALLCKSLPTAGSSSIIHVDSTTGNTNESCWSGLQPWYARSDAGSGEVHERIFDATGDITTVTGLRNKRHRVRDSHELSSARTRQPFCACW